MKAAWIVLFLAMSVSLANGAIPSEPDFTFRWSGYTSVTTVDSFAIAATSNGLVILQRVPNQIAFEPINYVLLSTPPLLQKQFGSLLVVRNVADQLQFFDLSTLPNPHLLGTVDIGVPFNDYALYDSTLYVSRGFDGLRRYRLHTYDNAEFLDSNLTGIKYTRLAIQGDTLLALDEYNGILFFRLQDTSFAQFLDYLFIPFQVQSFAAIDSGLAIGVADSAIMIAKLDSVPQIVDSIGLLFSPRGLFRLGNNIIAADPTSGFFEGVNLLDRTHTYVQSGEPPLPGADGTVAEIDSQHVLIFPTQAGSLLMYNGSTLAVSPAIPLTLGGHAGPLTGLAMSQGKLFLGGLNNPLDVYSIAENGQPEFQQTLYAGINHITGIQQVRDSLFVLYPQIRRALTIRVTPDSNIYRGGLFLDTTHYYTIRFNPKRIDSLRSYIAIGYRDVSVYTLSDSGTLRSTGTIQAFTTINDAEIVDSILVIAAGKVLTLYRLYDDFSTEYRGSYQPGFTVKEMIPYQGSLVIFDGRMLRVLDVRQATAPHVIASLQLPDDVYAAAAEDDVLYTVGKSGLAVVRMGGTVPRLLDFGGRHGSLIAVENGIVAISDSNAVHIYDLRNIQTDVTEAVGNLPGTCVLEQNYPNPFNPSTTIRFTLPRRARVTLNVYNLLGQEVTTLLDEELSAGSHQAMWNATDRSGAPVATGLYLYRLTAGDWVQSRKMLLLR